MPTLVDLAQLVREAGFSVEYPGRDAVYGKDDARRAWVTLWRQHDGMIQLSLDVDGIKVTPHATADVEKLRKWLRLDLTYRGEKGAAA